MKLSVEISMYAMKDDFFPAVDAFLADLNASAEIEVKTSSISTQLFGEYEAVMELLQTAMKKSFQEYGKACFVTKFLQGDTRVSTGYD
ncbi:MAG: hypothetical protein QGI68_05385 [Pseudomonadales bacterium]|jgi:uncharacterized protein YqgV (UPF0045/DUF77 family)|nr:hypothetical protein [Pseudomonadales bacterium]MDP7144800.1 hypothetical protein [Pseudomonadales bacterium]MDP7360241.1 hypothetical protein [Pseudomonadales bacterium]MDP7594986.1 hypothetical protein [Pseudomonadales bacterium]HJN53359.1 hypothetical protein [Pseudomonadales bacterium]|tara:strand:+ start:78 stop:341 length:264 start_codon:yes stop_codon:yes gene_type:complete